MLRSSIYNYGVSERLGLVCTCSLWIREGSRREVYSVRLLNTPFTTLSLSLYVSVTQLKKKNMYNFLTVSLEGTCCIFLNVLKCPATACKLLVYMQWIKPLEVLLFICFFFLNNQQIRDGWIPWRKKYIIWVNSEHNYLCFACKSLGVYPHYPLKTDLSCVPLHCIIICMSILGWFGCLNINKERSLCDANFIWLKLLNLI